MSLTHTPWFAWYAEILTCCKWPLLLYRSANVITHGIVDITRFTFNMTATHGTNNVAWRSIVIIDFNELAFCAYHLCIIDSLVMWMTSALLRLRWTMLRGIIVCLWFVNISITVPAVRSLQIVTAAALGNIHVRNERGYHWTLWVMFTPTTVSMPRCKVDNEMCNSHKKWVCWFFTECNDLVLLISFKSHTNNLTRIHYLRWQVGVVELYRR